MSFDVDSERHIDSVPDASNGSDRASSGPFAAPINSVLRASFGQSIDHLDVRRGEGESSRALNARAYTIGTTIALGDDIREDVHDPASMEIIAHEVAHALAGGGSGDKLVDGGRDDAGEVGAHAASSMFRDFIAGGQAGPAPRLSPAHGGTATVHRWEAGEHADSIDNAAATAAAAGRHVDPATAAAMARPITLANGVTVTQGQITAMMGDFYGSYRQGPDGREHFDPMASFEAMNHADPEEMRALQEHIAEEQRRVTAQRNGTGPAFEPSDNAELEAITRGRHQQTDATGLTTGYSFMELAQRNTNHFNSQDESGTDNNMGAYGALHAAAVQAAQDAANAPPEQREAAQQRALALEASAQHFETDRFSSGHQFDKNQMVQENGGGMMGNLRSRVMHDQLNENGTMVENSRGERWNAFGDEHWAEEGNAENRVRTAQAAMDSYGEINAVMTGQRPASDVANPTATAHQSVPEYNADLNARTQRQGAALGLPEMALKEAGQIAVLPAMAMRSGANLVHSVEDGASAAWDWTKGAASTAWDWTKGAAGTVADTVSDGASAAWDWTKGAANTVADGASAAWDWTRDTASSAAHTVSDGASAAWDWTRGAASTAADTVSSGASAAWDATRGAASTVADTVSSGASAAWDATRGAASTVADTVSSGASTAWNATTGAARAVGGAVSDGASWVGQQASDTWHAFTGLFD